MNKNLAITENVNFRFSLKLEIVTRYFNDNLIVDDCKMVKREDNTSH